MSISQASLAAIVSPLRWLAAAALIVIVDLGAIVFGAMTYAADPPSDVQGTGTGRLELYDDGFVVGRLMPSEQGESVRWQADGFTEPLDFELNEVRRITLEPAVVQRERPQPDATQSEASSADLITGDAKQEFACMLAGGDCLYGYPISLSPDHFLLQTAYGQQLRIDRSMVARLVRSVAGQRRGRQVSQDDPGRKTPWQFDLTGQRWAPGVESLDRKVTEAVTGSGEFIDLDLKSQCVLEVDVVWESTPQFELALAIAHAHDSLQQAIRLTVWDGELVLVRELDSQLHLAVVLPATELAKLDHVQLKLYLDPAAGRVVARRPSGELLTEFSVPADNELLGVGVRSFVGETTQVMHLAATPFVWSELPGLDHASDSAPVVLRSGEVVAGEIERLDETMQQIQLKHSSGERLIAFQDIQQLILNPVNELPPGHTTADESAAPLFQIDTADDWHIQGYWLGVDLDQFRLKVEGIAEPVAVPLGQLQRISNRRRARADSITLKASRSGRLIAEGISLRGKVVASDPGAKEPQLRWQPEGSLNSAPLRLPIDGEIVYRSVQPANQTIGREREMERVPQGAVGGVLWQLLGGPARPAIRLQRVGPTDEIVKGNPALNATPASSATLFLRTGDTVTCEIEAIDEQGVRFSSSAVEQGLARHDQVKTVILAPLVQPKQISEATRDRLLMVPRSRRDDPPTHLICSRTGDFLRGRLIGLDDQVLRMETRLERREIPRERIAQIFWLHPQTVDEQSPEEQPQEALVTEAQPENRPFQRAQALRRDGTRMTFDYHTCRDDSVLVGHSDLLGECQIDVLQLDRLLLGSAVERSADESPLALWRLHAAPIPKAFLPGAEGAGPSGTESALVGKPAPPFQLELLDGKKFQLAENHGRVVVLDFWASWCGPCIQAMPQIEEVVREFPQDRVQLVAVNLQESAETIKPALARMGLEEVTVALDRSGSVAELYGVTAIPQTVIIGPTGDVARLYVGVNSSLASDLHAAITELLQPEAAEQAIENE